MVFKKESWHENTILARCYILALITLHFSGVKDKIAPKERLVVGNNRKYGTFGLNVNQLLLNPTHNAQEKNNADEFFTFSFEWKKTQTTKMTNIEHVIKVGGKC